MKVIFIESCTECPYLLTLSKPHGDGTVDEVYRCSETDMEIPMDVQWELLRFPNFCPLENGVA